MKKIPLISLILLLTLWINAQTVIENPGIGFSTTYNLKIKSIELRDTATVISFRASYPGAGGYNITVPKETYIQPENGKKLFITAAEGILLNKTKVMPPSGETDYKLFFPKIDASVTRLDYGEERENASWFFYDIILRELPKQSVVPRELRANWFNKKTGEWEISFFDSTAVYKKKVWYYGKVSLSNGEGTLELKDNKSRVILSVKPTDGGYLIGEANSSPNAYVQNPVEASPDKEGWQVPVFRYDSVNFSGYFKGYSPRMNKKTINIQVDDILTGKKYLTVAKLDDKGVFSVKLPLYYPHSVFINSVGTGQSVFLEPGKDIFVLFDSPRNSRLFMGESTKINSDLFKFEKFTSIDISPISKKIHDLTSFQFKSECLDVMQKEMDALDAFREAHSIGTKAYNVKKRDLEFRIYTYLLQYNFFTQQDQIAKDRAAGRVTVFTTEKFPAEYYDFIKNEKVNDPIAVISTNYGDFMTLLQENEFIVRGQGLPYLDMIEALETSGYALTTDEKKLKENINIMENPEDKAVMDNFNKKYGSKFFELNSKYSNQRKEFNREIIDGTMTISTVYDSLTKKGVNFTEDERAVIEQRRIVDNLPATIMISKTHKSRDKFYSDHKEFVDSLRQQRAKLKEEENLGKLGIEKGLAVDILEAKKDLRQIVTDLVPFSDKAVKTISSQFNNPFIADYIVLCNKSTKEKIEANKKKRGSIVNVVPKIEKEKLFEELMKKYIGKVILVDFWATWCGPCRVGIEQIKPLKEEMANDKVAFVYITGPTSPKQTFDNMIPGIKGEHYMVSAEEWSYLESKFNFSTIPHEVLLDKKGKVINPNLPPVGNEQLKNLLMKYIKE